VVEVEILTKRSVLAWEKKGLEGERRAVTKDVKRDERMFVPLVCSGIPSATYVIMCHLLM